MTPLEYRYHPSVLKAGSSLGNLYTFARLDGASNLKGLWSSTDDFHYAGEWTIDILAEGKPLAPVETRIRPESQITVLGKGEVTATKTFLLPLSETGAADPSDHRCAVVTVALRNSSDAPVVFHLCHDIVFSALRSELFTKQPPDSQVKLPVRVRHHDGHCEAVTEGMPGRARALGGSIPWDSCHTADGGASIEYLVKVGAGALQEVTFALAYSPDGTAAALDQLRRILKTDSVAVGAGRALRPVLEGSRIFTPDPLINRGLQWAKVNMMRVLHRYLLGEAFTNDPPQDIVVVRDVAWFILGADYVAPDFCRDLIAMVERHGTHPEGKLTEFIHAGKDPVELNDYRLDINDDTPLFVHALHHHALACDGEYALERAYPLMAKACGWILSQIRDDLVHCDAEGTGVWGICSWRNIIPGYTLSGAVTEINAECYHALRITAESASHLGQMADAARFGDAAQRLKTAINTRLRSERHGMYLLNIDTHGARHHDITGDLVFPVMFGVTDDETKRKILDRLRSPDLWTRYGVRSVSAQEWNYDPEFGYQLVGGIWPNLTAWVAYCHRHASPSILVEGMQNIYRISEAERPVEAGHVVPGEFPERLHGTNFRSRGMTLSPWMPPTYFWLGVEGLLGIEPALEGIGMTPSLPYGWEWVAVRNLPYHGSLFSAFVHKGTLYATRDVRSTLPVRTGTPMTTFSDDDRLFTIGLGVGDDVLLFVASDGPAEGNVTVQFHNARAEKHVKLKDRGAMLVVLPGFYEHAVRRVSPEAI